MQIADRVEEENMKRTMMRGGGRQLWVIVTVIALLAVACGSESTDDTTADGTASSTTATVAATGELEMISPWTSGGENAALNALVEVYQQQYPGVEFVNAAIGGGGGDAARPMLLTRLQAGDPPDLWQGHGGAELMGDYVDPGFAGSVTGLYESEGWLEVAPQGLIDVLEQGNDIYAVPFGVHRTNMLWYNTPVLEANGVEIGDEMSLDDFFAAADQLKAADVDALCVGDKDPWPSAQLFEATLAASLTPDQYRGLWDGTTPFDSTEVRAAAEAYARMLDYRNSDHSALTWDQAIEKVIDGSCAMSIMGDWAYAEFLQADLENGVDFGWIAAPGSSGVFVVNNDIAVRPVAPPHPENVDNFLRVLGSPEGQTAFNVLKGSIPWRTDIDPAAFPPYQQEAMEAYGQLPLVPSVVHGLAAPAAFRQALLDAVTPFGVSADVDTLVGALVAATGSLGG
jgi:glucose/mannose transport system substrate-binding protein